MRSSTISNLAVLASSLLVKEVVAGRYDVRKRDLYVVTDSVIVTEEVTVTQEADGSYVTGVPVPIGTVTVDGTPVLVPVSAAASSTPIPSVPSISAPSPSSTSSEAAAVFIQETQSTSTPPPPAPTTSTTPVAVEQPTTTEAPVSVAPTTLATVVSSAAPAQTSTASSSSGTTSGSKRGLAYNDASLLSGFTSSSQISWAYNWGSSTASIPSEFEYVPLLWGLASGFTNNWIEAAEAAIKAGSKHLMSFNEPDLDTQSNLSPEAAAAGYQQYLSTPFAGKALLGSPAVTNGGGSMGLTWLASFLAACTGCQIDFVPIHWYNGGDASAFMDYIDQAFITSQGRPLWITEFQGSGDASEQNSFLEAVIPQLDASDKVARYAYFMASDGNLLSSGSTLSTLGETFASYA